jgi:hypothetical protein
MRRRREAHPWKARVHMRIASGHRMAVRLPRDLGSVGGRVRNVGRASPSLAMVLALCCVVTGCVTSKEYRLAKADTPAAQPLGLSVSTGQVDLALATVIVFKGPGSWKREARWDEYVVRLVNHHEQPVVIESAELIDLQGQARIPGDGPWKLERLSRTNWDKYGKTGLKIVAGVGAAALYAEAVMGAASVAILSSAETAGAAGGGATALAAIPVIGLVDVSTVAIMNHNNKARVEHEYQRRRLKLPDSVAPGESLTGSLFFPHDTRASEADFAGPQR